MGATAEGYDIEAVEVRLEQEEHRDGHWLVVTGWLAGQQLRRIYWEKPDE